MRAQTANPVKESNMRTQTKTKEAAKDYKAIPQAEMEKVKKISLREKFGTYQGVSCRNIEISYFITDPAFIEFFSQVSKISGNAVSPNNIINILLFFEKDICGQDKIENTYKILASIIQDAKKTINDSLTPEEKLKNIQQVLIKNLKIVKTKTPVFLLSEGLSTPDNFLDDNLLSIIYMAVAYELKLPLALVRISGHSFLRWDGGSEMRFNFEPSTGEIISDESYKKLYNISEDKIDWGIHLKNLTSKELVGLFYNNIGGYYFKEGDQLNTSEDKKQRKSAVNFYNKALDNYQKSREFYSKDPSIYYNIGTVMIYLENYETAAGYFDNSLYLDPNNAEFLNNRGNAQIKIGDFYKKTKKTRSERSNTWRNYEEAINNYKKALAINPNLAAALYNLGNAQIKLGEHLLIYRDGNSDGGKLDSKEYYRDAISYYEKAIKLYPSLTAVHKTLVLVKKTLNRMAGYDVDYTRSIWPKPIAGKDEIKNHIWFGPEGLILKTLK
jgi:tetratricopeptide (TPR) repeat protein